MDRGITTLIKDLETEPELSEQNRRKLVNILVTFYLSISENKLFTLLFK